MIPVYVPSKGRAGTSTTLSALSSEGFQGVTVCTTASEEKEYRERYASQEWDIIQQRGSGISGARQTILETARQRGDQFIWMLDDDTTAVYQRYEAEGRMRFRRTTWDYVLSGIYREAREIQRGAMGRVITMAGPQFRQWAWQGPDFEWDVHLRNFILINVYLFNYWPHVKEDADMVLQMLTSGYSTLRFNSYAFASPHMGTLAGGCSDDYAAGALEEASKALAEKWPGVVSMRLNEKTGYVENRVDWKRARGQA